MRQSALAVTTAQRIPSITDLPTVAESGVPGFEVVGWYGFLAPAGTPKAAGASLHAEIVKILRADLVKWAKVVKASRARLD